MVIKCDRRIPPDTSVKLEQVRDKLVKEIMEKKVQQEMQLVFKELRDKAGPQLVIKGAGQPEDLLAQTQSLLANTPLGGAPPK